MLPTKTKGIYLAVITAVISGVSIFINKFAVDAVQPPILFTGVKNAGVGLLIISIILLSGKWKLLKSLTRKQIFGLIMIALVGGTVPFYLFFTGLSMVPAINAAFRMSACCQGIARCHISLSILTTRPRLTG